MRDFATATLRALLIAVAIFATTSPAPAYVDVGISFGFAGPDYTFDPCDYYDYYDAPPPWGLPADYCDYPVYFEPVFYDGFWYRGPIYYRWYRSQRVFFLNGSWHADGWRGGSRPSIAWQNRGGWNNGFRPGMRPGPGFRRAMPRDWRTAPSSAGNRPEFNNGHGWTGGERPFAGPLPGPGGAGPRGPAPWTSGGRPYGGGPPPWAGGRGPEGFNGGPLHRGPPHGGFPSGHPGGEPGWHGRGH